MIADQLARAASEPLMADDLFSLDVLVSQQRKNELILGMQVFDLDGALLASAGLSPNGSKLPTELSVEQDILSDATQNTWSKTVGRAILFMAPVNFNNTSVGFALVSIDKRPLEKNLKGMINALLTTTIGLMTLGTLLAFPLAHRLCRPIHRLVEVGEAIDRGETNSLQEEEERKDEIGKIFASFNRMAASLEEKRHVEQTLSRYISPGIAQRVLSSTESSRLGGSTAEGSVLFCDIVGFTELSENLAPDQVADLLNDYFRYFALASSCCQGTVDKFIGDCIMILFGVPERDSHHALHAATCAVLIQAVADQINQRRESRGQTAVQFRIGINSGSMLAGNVGSEDRMQYTVVGDTVNVASRICALSNPGGILLTGEMIQQPGIKRIVKQTQMTPIKIRGRKNPVNLYAIDTVTFSEASLVSESLQNILGG